MVDVNLHILFMYITGMNLDISDFSQWCIEKCELD